jgi:hypothetical protein
MAKREIRPASRVLRVPFAVLKHESDTCKTVLKNRFAEPCVTQIRRRAIAVFSVNAGKGELLYGQ